MNIKEIAKLAGVSVATVSRVINNNPNVSSASKEKVLSVMAENNYTPNLFARGLNTKSINTVGILCPDIGDVNHARTVSSLEHSLRDRGYDVLLCCTGRQSKSTHEYLHLLSDKRVDAIFMVGCAGEEDPELSEYQKSGKRVPLIIVNGYLDLPGVYCVLCDERTAMCDMVKELFERGCRNMAFIEDSDTYSAYQKRQGFLDGIKLCGLTPNPKLHIRIDPFVQSELFCTKSIFSQLFEAGERIDAILTADDILAVGALQAMVQAGRSFPIIGFNNSEHAVCCTPALTSMDNRIDVQCNIAVETMLDILQGKDAIDKLVVSAKLEERETYRRE